MKKSIIISALVLAGVLGFSSCSDFLDADNKSNISADKYFTTEAGFENLTATAYYKLRAIYDGTPDLFCSGTDLYEKGRSNYSDVTLFNYKQLNSSNGNVLDLYKNCYAGIQAANAVIYYGSSAAGKNVSQRVAEAKFLKAFNYYILSQQFGGVPLSDEYIQGNVNIARASLADTYTYIINLLTSIEGSDSPLPDTDLTGRASKRAVHNLLAKVYLAAGWDLGTTANADGSNVTVSDKTFFSKAAEEADLAIAGQKPTLSFSQFWDVANDNNNETIFSIQYTRGITGQDETTDGNGYDQNFSNYYNDGGTSYNTKYTNSQFPVSEKMIYLYEPGDTRYAGTFMRKQYYGYYSAYNAANAAKDSVYLFCPAWYEDMSKLGNYVTDSTGYKSAAIYSASNPCIWVKAVYNKRTHIYSATKGTQTYETSRTTTAQSMCIRKFDDYNATRNTTKKVSFHNIVLAHLTETYLIAAEAYHMAGDDATSLARLNVVRERAGAETLSSYASYVRHYSDGTDKSYNAGNGISSVPSETNLDPVDVILDERARELCGEGYRWMDLRRTKRLISYNVKYNSAVSSADDFKGTDGQYKWYRPIPQDELNLNTSMTADDQNPGYKE